MKEDPYIGILVHFGFRIHLLGTSVDLKGIKRPPTPGRSSEEILIGSWASPVKDIWSPMCFLPIRRPNFLKAVERVRILLESTVMVPFDNSVGPKLL